MDIVFPQSNEEFQNEQKKEEKEQDYKHEARQEIHIWQKLLEKMPTW